MIIQYLVGKKALEGDQAEIGLAGNSLSGKSLKELAPGEGLTVAVNLPQNYILPSKEEDRKENQRNEDAEQSSSTNGREVSGSGGWKDYAFPIPLALLLWLIGSFRKKGMNKKRMREVVEQYYPPDNMSSAEVGTFYDYRVDDRDLISLIPKWGNDGIVEVRSIPSVSGRRDLYFYKLKELPDTAFAYEREFFTGLFKEGDSVFISDLKDKFYSVMSKARGMLKKEVLEFKLYERESIDTFKSWKSVVGFILLVAGGILSMALLQMYITGIALIILGISLLVIMFFKPKFTEEGLDLHDYLQGLKKFLDNPGDGKINELMSADPKYLDNVFPYVVAFGIDKSWNEQISKSNHYYNPPAWYHYQDINGNRQRNVSIGDFGSSFSVKTINSVFSSAPHSSGSGGSSGGSFSGGSSGGGFGGGGGSSW